jgi:NACHT domain
LDSTKYQDWLSTSKQILFCPGIPGAGKTILTSIMIDDICRRFHQDHTVGIAFIYCNFRRKDEQGIVQLLANLLKQLSQSQSSVPKVVEKLHEHHTERQTQPSLAEISTALQSVVALYSRVFVVIDALDECQEHDGCHTRLLKEIFNLRAKYGVNFFATSRFIAEIVTEFEGCPSLVVRASDKDLRSYLDGYLLNLPSFVRRSPELQERVRESIIEAVDGMCVVLQTRALWYLWLILT